MNGKEEEANEYMNIDERLESQPSCQWATDQYSQFLDDVPETVLI